MNPTKTISMLILLGLVLAASACSFSVSTANIGGLKIGKDKEMSHEAAAFDATDKIFSAVTISNNPGAVKVKGSLHVVEIEGQKPGPIPGLETTVAVDGDATTNFNFSPPTNGWPKGKYKFEAIMLNENGEQKDSKSHDFTVN